MLYVQLHLYHLVENTSEPSVLHKIDDFQHDHKRHIRCESIISIALKWWWIHKLAPYTRDIHIIRITNRIPVEITMTETVESAFKLDILMAHFQVLGFLRNFR